MVNIDNANNYCTLINVFTVSPDDYTELFGVLQEATVNVMSKLPGYISANIHISDDKKTITNYAQWASLEDFQNMQKNPEAQEHMKLAAKIATGFKPGIYSSIWQHTGKVSEFSH